MSQEDPPETGNALFLTVFDISAFRDLADFHDDVDKFIDWLKSSPPMEGFEEVMLPGEKSYKTYQARRKNGLDVDDTAWEQITALAGELGIAVPEPVT